MKSNEQIIREIIEQNDTLCLDDKTDREVIIKRLTSGLSGKCQCNDPTND